MADEQKPDKAMAGMLKRKSVWPHASTREACPDAAILAAYFDHSLSASEISQCELHFSACLRCQEQLAALVRSEPTSVATPAVGKKPAIAWLWDWRWMAPVGAAVVALVFFVSYKTMYAPAGPLQGGELMAKREAPTPPAADEPQKPAEPAAGKTQAAADAISPAKSPSAPQRVTGRSDLDKLQRANEAAALQAARAVQAEKDKGARLAEAASGVVAGRLMPKPADEEKQIATAESRLTVAQPQAPGVSASIQAETAKTQDRVAEANRAQAAPVQGAEAGILGAQKQDRAIPIADAKEPVAHAPAGVKAKEQGALKKESAVGRQEAATGSYALQSAPRLRAAQGELIVAAPNSKVLWRFGSAGQIERSRDAGKTWETQKSPAQESFLSGSASSETICWVGGSNGVLLRTTDGGENWERIPSPTNGGIISIKATDQLTATLITADGRTFETRDAGAHWRAR